MSLKFKNIIKILFEVPFKVTNVYLSFCMNVVFYASMVFNVGGIYIGESVRYIGTSWLLAFFSSFSAFVLMYICPFFFKFDNKDVLSRLYWWLLFNLTITTVLLLYKAPSCIFLLLLIIMVIIFNVSYSSSPYIMSLSHLKEMPLKTRYINLFYDILKLVVTMFFIGIWTFLFFEFPIVLQTVCLYTYGVSLYYVLPIWFNTIKNKKNRHLPTSIIKLKMFFDENKMAFFDICVLYLAVLTFFRSYGVFAIAFLFASYVLSGIHIFVYYIITICMVTLLVSFNCSQKYLKKVYGAKSLRLLGWNSPSKTLFSSQKTIVVTATTIALSVLGFSVASRNENDKECVMKGKLRSTLEADYKRSIIEASHDKHLQKVLENSFEHNIKAARNPTISETRQSLIKDLLDPVGAFIKDVVKKK